MKHAGLATGLVCLLVGGCGGGGSPTPTAPSSSGTPSALAPGAGTPFLGVGAADFAVCLRGSQEPACFSAARLRIRATAAAVNIPGAPGNLTVTVTGNSVSLVWSTPTSGDAVFSYVLEAGSVSGASNLANIVTNSTATTFSASGIGAGTYFVRVRAQNGGGVSPPSNEVVVIVGTIGCASSPNAPGGLSATVSGTTVTLTWSAPASGCAATSYVLQAGSGPGLSNLANFNTGNSATTYVASAVGVGTYFVRVRAVNGNGTSGPSNEIILTVGSVCASLTVNNYSFEIVPSGGFPFTAGCQGQGCSYSEGVGRIPGWVNTTSSGEFIPGVQVGNRFAFDTIPDGSTVAFANAATISQTVGATVQVGAMYTLQVDLGWRKDFPVFTGTAGLLVNGRQHVATGTTPVRGNWSTFTATYTGLAADAGAPITIQLNTLSLQADFDNVRLSYCGS